ncbi:hypothetical protein Rsub_09554 [Raphidocelis subcapitata]|uniref:Uncharacterized protein n=1 Tax=Raphidocelis subcapitata TaxID=307507 RepID=A0A2V0PCZ3_9CHLO|nr:hypothetical protein Rsub_09554 [Raphidocelis subcapitata]|eukprot:GBF97389.1 hypothetical protein Rsub_09554 [Raphidocelis subcapitata]
MHSAPSTPRGEQPASSKSALQLVPLGPGQPRPLRFQLGAPPLTLALGGEAGDPAAAAPGAGAGAGAAACARARVGAVEGPGGRPRLRVEAVRAVFLRHYGSAAPAVELAPGAAAELLPGDELHLSRAAGGQLPGSFRVASTLLDGVRVVLWRPHMDILGARIVHNGGAVEPAVSARTTHILTMSGISAKGVAACLAREAERAAPRSRLLPTGAAAAGPGPAWQQPWRRAGDARASGANAAAPAAAAAVPRDFAALHKAGVLFVVEEFFTRSISEGRRLQEAYYLADLQSRLVWAPAGRSAAAAAAAAAAAGAGGGEGPEAGGGKRPRLAPTAFEALAA